MRRAWLTAAVLVGCTAAAGSAFANAVTHPVAASTPATVAGAEMTQPEPATTIGAGEDMMSFEESTDATCEDYGFFAADKRGDCDKACKKGKKCAKKEMCGDGQCPPPGYCWKCPN